MCEAEQRPFAVRDELDLDRRRAGRNDVRAVAVGLPAPRVDEPARPIELDELAARDLPGDDLDPVSAARRRVERLRGAALPAGELRRVDEELPYRLGRRCD